MSAIIIYTTLYLMLGVLQRKKSIYLDRQLQFTHYNESSTALLRLPGSLFGTNHMGGRDLH